MTAAGRRPGYFTKRTAEAWLRSTLDEARRGVLPGMIRTGATFADAAAECLRYIELDRRHKPSTVAGYGTIVRSQLLPTFGEIAIESITPEMIDTWFASLDGRRVRGRSRWCLCTASSSGPARSGVYRPTLSPT